ncbi:hypothetical protein J3L18_04360 [Mucilaginibacter gossypii]|uniref:hypothetical protein n=1 Tax=Mucilaginibacter gossypii TaxID=551996 RepID=UPI000DCCD1E6|nr:MULTISPECIES: hypothetical protein [Mucilaginibacter]QTE38317.1 hypothetical protein J3L18_04360 [Mucilaginibacter gossypii]RAV49266.1 hypothetical protein DIU36_27755 [Mucilaginibacter rubeus]
MTAVEILKQERATLLQRVKAIDKAINALTKEAPNIRWTERSLSCIREKGHVCLSAEILECLFWDEQTNLADPKIRNNYMTGLSIALKNLVENGILKKISRPGIRGFYYGLPEWFDENNVVKAQYDVLKEINYTISI